MLNINSPTVQAMMNNLPQGVGNMPIYFGNQPQVTTEVTQQQPVQNSTGFSTPYPSPKDMVMQAGAQHQAYYPTTFTPQNGYVGGYNPGFQTAFQNYSNPYMGYGSYMGYGMMGGINPALMDDMSRAVYYNAIANSMSYEDQLKNDEQLYKSISKIVSKGLGRTEEEAKQAEATFDIVKPKPEPVQNTLYQVRPHNPMQVVLVRGDKEITQVVQTKVIDPMQNTQAVDSIARITDMMVREQYQKEMTFNLLHQNAPERMFDDKPFMYFMNHAGGPIYADYADRTLRMQKASNAKALYNAQEFRRKLLESNGIRTKSQINAIDRFASRNGILPNGMPVSPQHDPSIASSFSYNPATGTYDIEPPGFIRDRLEAARQRFINSIGQDRE